MSITLREQPDWHNLALPMSMCPCLQTKAVKNQMQVWPQGKQIEVDTEDNNHSVSEEVDTKASLTNPEEVPKPTPAPEADMNNLIFNETGVGGRDV